MAKERAVKFTRKVKYVEEWKKKMCRKVKKKGMKNERKKTWKFKKKVKDWIIKGKSVGKWKLKKKFE